MSAPYDYTQYSSAGSDPYGAPGYGQPPPSSYAPPSSYPPSSYPPPSSYAPPSSHYPPGGYAPPYGGYPPAAHPDEVRTIFITGFPADVKERELNNLLRFLHGYEASQMNWKNGQAQGFALFSSGALARAACDAITQLCFDDASVLRCEMARKNMYIKSGEADDPSIKRPRTSAYGSGGYAPSSAPSHRVQAVYVPSVGPNGDNPPCNTLFVGNLGDNVQESELQALFGSSKGFRMVKLVRGPRNTTCFVEYDDTDTAAAAHAAHQGAVLASSDRGGIRVQYSKNPYGKKRDATGNLIDTTPREDRERLLLGM